MLQHKPEEYTAIVYWGQTLGSFAYYVRAQQAQAAKDGAPLTAIYKDGMGRWQTIEDCLACTDHKERFQNWLDNPRRPMPHGWKR